MSIQPWVQPWVAHSSLIGTAAEIVCWSIDDVAFKEARVRDGAREYRKLFILASRAAEDGHGNEAHEAARSFIEAVRACNLTPDADGWFIHPETKVAWNTDYLGKVYE